MDRESSNATVYGAITTFNKPPDGQDNAQLQKKKKKKRGPMHLIRVALYMLKLGKSTKSSNAHLWKNFLGSVQPLQVQTQKSPPRLTEEPLVPLPNSPIADHLEVFTPPMSPANASVSSSCGMSQYGSASNLQELDQMDKNNESDHEDESYGNKKGDDMIDMKAEQFIAQFYHDMRVQNEVYTNRRNKRVNLMKSDN